MVLQLLASTIYGIVERSWMFSTVFVKYFLVIAAVYAFNAEEKFLERFQEFIDSSSREAALSIILVGTVSMILGIEFTPVLKIFSSAVALVYFGYLFWKF